MRHHAARTGDGLARGRSAARADRGAGGGPPGRRGARDRRARHHLRLGRAHRAGSSERAGTARPRYAVRRPCHGRRVRRCGAPTARRSTSATAWSGRSRRRAAGATAAAGGMPQKCRELRKYGHEKIAPRWELTGGFATHVHLRAGTAIVRVGEDLPASVLAPASCGTATAWAALARASRRARAQDAARCRGARLGRRSHRPDGDGHGQRPRCDGHRLRPRPGTALPRRVVRRGGRRRPHEGRGARGSAGSARA